MIDFDRRNNFEIDAINYEFIDFGCSGGGSLELYGKLFDAQNKGIGLDIDPKKVELAREKGFNAQVCDITKLKLNQNIKFGVMHHFLEHIPSVHDVRAIVNQACSVIDDFLIIRQPYFDADPYLFSKGLKFYWSNWKGHPNNMTLLEFHNILMPMASKGLIKNFTLYGKSLVVSSMDPCIHNLDSEIDQQGWDSNVHSKKREIEFTEMIFKETLAIIDLSGNATRKVESVIRPDKKLFQFDLTLK